MALCTLCGQRKGKRYCTASGEDICPQCCATEREVSINCPLACGYLRESRAHEKRNLNAEALPYREVHVDEQTMQGADILLMVLSGFLNRALAPEPNATDREAREALAAVIEKRPAAGVAERFQSQLDKFLAEFTEKRDTSAFSDDAIRKVLIFLARVAYGHDNGRPRCRSFVHYLHEAFPVDAP